MRLELAFPFAAVNNCPPSFPYASAVTEPAPLADEAAPGLGKSDPALKNVPVLLLIGFGDQEVAIGPNRALTAPTQRPEDVAARWLETLSRVSAAVDARRRTILIATGGLALVVLALAWVLDFGLGTGTLLVVFILFAFLALLKYLNWRDALLMDLELAP